MIAVIYARKSTEQQLPDAEKSIARQVAHARAYATRKGWTVAEAQVYADDGISSAALPVSICSRTRRDSSDM